MISPRTTRLVRAVHLHAFRHTLATLAGDGFPHDVLDRLVVVPTRAAAALLTTYRERLSQARGVLHPVFATAREVPARFAERAAPAMHQALPEAREILMGVASRVASDAGLVPPFELRPGLVAEMLDLYDALRRRRKDVATFERLALGRLEPGAEYDRGAERLVRQTRFLVSAFTAFERLSSEHGFQDEHALRRIALEHAARRPWRHIVIAVVAESFDRCGLSDADWDLVTRVDGLSRIDVIVTEATLAGAWHERIHDLLPGIEEVRVGDHADVATVLGAPAQMSDGGRGRVGLSARIWESRDREDEVSRFTGWVRGLHHENPALDLERIALVVQQPLPYVYLAREVLRSANVESQTFETVPLAAEPYAAALDLVFSAVNTNFSRTSVVALLGSPHFEFVADGRVVSAANLSAADQVLSEQGYLGGVEHLERIAGGAAEDQSSPRAGLAAPALYALRKVAEALEVLAHLRSAADHLDTLLAFLNRHQGRATDDPLLGGRERRARVAIHGILTVLAQSYRELDANPVAFGRVVLLVRRQIEVHTFAPHTGGGVYIVDAASAPFGDFDHAQLAGLIDGEWPRRVPSSIFYGTSLLRELGWFSEAQRMDHARASFRDLLGLPSRTLRVSTFSLEGDTVAQPSPLLDEVDLLPRVTEAREYEARMFEVDLLAREPVWASGLDALAAAWAELRLSRPTGDLRRFQGKTGGHHARSFSLSGLERYQDCPFTYFAHDVLRLPAVPEDEPFLSPRARGRFVHEVFQRFFEVWDAANGPRGITADSLDEARRAFAAVAGPLLDALGESDRVLERARLFGSAISVGMLDVVLQIEATRPHVVVERWLEVPVEGEFSLGHKDGPRVPIRGIADRVDLLGGHRLRVIDYKTGRAPAPERALQVPVYALCTQERVERRDGHPWAIEEAAYVALSGKRPFVPIVSAGEDPSPALDAARARVLDVITGVEGGEFGPRPHDLLLCRVCAYPSVCRKDYVDER